MIRLVSEHLALLNLDSTRTCSILIIIIFHVARRITLILNINLVKMFRAWDTSLISIPSLSMVVRWLLIPLGMEATRWDTIWALHLEIVCILIESITHFSLIVIVTLAVSHAR